jgi:hypothetical protein
MVLLALGVPAEAAEVRSFRMQTRDSFLNGTLDGISVDSLGILQLADRVERLAEIGEPFLLSAAAHPEGWVLGTGNAGRVLLAKPSGELVVLHSAPEPEIFAVWADDDGTVFAGSSPGGKVYESCWSPPAPKASSTRWTARATASCSTTVKTPTCACSK